MPLRNYITSVLMALAIAAGLPSAAAVAGPPLQEFSVQLKDVKRDGRFKMVVVTRTTALDGSVADPLTNGQFRFPYGVKIRKAFLKGRFFCDLSKLTQTKNPDSCKNAAIGSGTAVADARPLFPDPIPAKLTIFLGKGSPGAVANLVILAEPESSDPIVASYQPILQAPIYNDPTPDRRFGYRIDLDARIETPIPNLSVSVPEVITTISGLSKAVGKGKSKRVFWATPPKCANSKTVSFQGVFTYQSSPQVVKDVALNCLAH